MSEPRDVDIFTEALRLTGSARAEYLRVAVGADEELRQRVDKLLRAFEDSGDFLGQPAAGAPSPNSEPVLPLEGPGSRVGRYKLLQQIGEGGCGVVFMAEQEEPVRRQVALKVIKPGMDTKNVIARFEAERQALALMDHPNIAHVLDAGATTSGRPYFVMELVRGLKITDYCDQKSLSTAQRLDLFVQVCGAVQHAHQKGIIHRDIKPSNILVTTSGDGKPTPKVIDFGIAKATTGQKLTDKTLFTAFEMLIGTPAYMSPEQAELTSVDVDTRSDIYSLGVLLYELLTGTTPFDTQELLKAGLDEVRRVIREEEPVRPSTRLSTMVAADLTTISHQRGAEPPKLIRDVRGDLDWIVMKAMEKDRNRRYETANGLAMDIDRFLAGDVVLARPPSPLYKARKLIARNKPLFSALALVILLLALSLAIALRLLAVERKASEIAHYRVDADRLETLGELQFAQTNIEAADAYFQKALEIRRKYLGGERPNVLVIETYVGLLKREHKEHELDTYAATLVGSNGLADPGFADLADIYADNLGTHGKWDKAVVVAADCVQAQPERPGFYHTLAPLLVATHDETAYRRLCPQIVARFENMQDVPTADKMAKDCLILPSAGVNLEAVAAMANVAYTRGTNSPSFPLFQCCKALAEYRLGYYDEAATVAESAAKKSFVYSKAEGYAILAMARFKLAQTNEAREALTACDNVIGHKLPKLESHNLGGDWRDWIIAHALQKEAEGVINDASP